MADNADTQSVDSGDVKRERFDVYVRWERGEPHQYEEVVRASDPEMAMTLAKRNVDVRQEPVSLRIVPRQATLETPYGDVTLTPHTDREYRNVTGYFTKEVETDDKQLNQTVSNEL